MINENQWLVSWSLIINEEMCEKCIFKLLWQCSMIAVISIQNLGRRLFRGENCCCIEKGKKKEQQERGRKYGEVHRAELKEWCNRRAQAVEWSIQRIFCREKVVRTKWNQVVVASGVIVIASKTVHAEEEVQMEVLLWKC